MLMRKDGSLLEITGKVETFDVRVVNGRVGINFNGPKIGSLQRLKLPTLNVQTIAKLRDKLTDTLIAIEQQEAADKLIAEFAEGTPPGIIADKLNEAGYKAAAEPYYKAAEIQRQEQEKVKLVDEFRARAKAAGLTGDIFIRVNEETK